MSLKPLGRHSNEKELIRSSENETILIDCSWTMSRSQRRFVFERILRDQSRGCATVHRISRGQYLIQWKTLLGWGLQRRPSMYWDFSRKVIKLRKTDACFAWTSMKVFSAKGIRKVDQSYWLIDRMCFEYSMERHCVMILLSSNEWNHWD